MRLFFLHAFSKNEWDVQWDNWESKESSGKLITEKDALLPFLSHLLVMYLWHAYYLQGVMADSVGYNSSWFMVSEIKPT